MPSDIPSDKGADDKGTRRFETDLDFKPRLSVVVKLLCWLLPPALLLFWHVQFAPVAMQLAEASWRRTAMWALSWLAKVATSVAVSGTLQCQLVQRQVRGGTDCLWYIDMPGALLHDGAPVLPLMTPRYSCLQSTLRLSLIHI